MLWRIAPLDNNNLLKFKPEIFSFLIESYLVNFDLSEEKCITICNEKIDLLNIYLKQNRATLIGAIDNGKLAGFIWIYKYTYFEELRLHINQIVVSKAYRGRGIAKRLIKEAETFAIDNGIKIIDLNVSEKNIEAIDMYDNIGFSTERRLMKKLL